MHHDESSAVMMPPVTVRPDNGSLPVSSLIFLRNGWSRPMKLKLIDCHTVLSASPQKTSGRPNAGERRTRLRHSSQPACMSLW